jgi:ketosteroid isomerase-like protein
MPDDLVSRFRTTYEASAAAFNEGDLDQALGMLPEDIEWHAPSEFPDHRIYQGPAEIKVWFEELRSIFDRWQIELRHFDQLSDGAILVHHVIRGTSRGAGVPVEVVTYELWEFSPLTESSHQAWQFLEMRPIRVRQFASREEALAAAAT